MKFTKQGETAPILIRFFTMCAIIGTLQQGLILLFSIIIGVFSVETYEESRLYETTQVAEIFSVLAPKMQISQRNSENYMEHNLVLKELEEDYSIQQTNLQIKITENDSQTVLVDSFGTENYGKISRIYVNSDGYGWTWGETDTNAEFIIDFALQSPLTVPDFFLSEQERFQQFHEKREDTLFFFVANLVFSLIGLVFVVKTAKSSESLISKWIPADVFFLGNMILFTLLFENFSYYASSNVVRYREFFFNEATYPLKILCLVIALGIISYIIMKSVEILGMRVKNSVFFKKTILGATVIYGKDCCKKLPIVWRTLLIGLVICAINGILGMLSMHHVFYWLIFALYNLILLLFFCGLSWQMKLLQSGAESLATGHFQEKIDTKMMYFDCKKYGTTLNQIGDGIGLAVEEKIRSERLKTELITNVSHDIKTPLTSIVTSVELLQKNHSEQERQEHLGVLQRQSMRMKKLVEDLVEASKVNTGNLSVNFMETDLVEAVQQALGEYEDKFTAKNLQIMTTYQENCVVQADGKHLWRVLDNLLSNVSKYAQSGTRVYISVEKSENTSEISIKNISAEPLNVEAEDLMERFVRGDESRTTDGSGLGLNIAQGLMQVQGGRLELFIDGDLLKVLLIFSEIEKNM